MLSFSHWLTNPFRSFLLFHPHVEQGSRYKDRQQSEKRTVVRKMIYEGEKNITDIAYELGYAHPQHFHRAFKKQFGGNSKKFVEVIKPVYSYLLGSQT